MQRSRLRAASALAQGYLALARGDTIGALRRFESVPDTACISCLTDRLTKARLLASQGRDREAAVLLGARLNRNPALLEPMFALERARVRERLGERAGAIEAYGFVIRVWRNADPVLLPLVREAREGLARLTKESGA
jgi:tetratricopeptide (TPR) repeat protein